MTENTTDEPLTEEELDAAARAIAKVLKENHAKRMADRKPVAQELAGVVSVLKEIAGMALDHRNYEEIAAEAVTLAEIVSLVELIAGFHNANKPAEQQHPPPPPPPSPEPDFTDTDQDDALLRTLKLIAQDIADYPALAPLVLTDLEIQLVSLAIREATSLSLAVG